MQFFWKSRSNKVHQVIESNYRLLLHRLLYWVFSCLDVYCKTPNYCFFDIFRSMEIKKINHPQKSDKKFKHRLIFNLLIRTHTLTESHPLLFSRWLIFRVIQIKSTKEILVVVWLNYNIFFVKQKPYKFRSNILSCNVMLDVIYFGKFQIWGL